MRTLLVSAALALVTLSSSVAGADPIPDRPYILMDGMFQGDTAGGLQVALTPQMFGCTGTDKFLVRAAWVQFREQISQNNPPPVGAWKFMVVAGQGLGPGVPAGPTNAFMMYDGTGPAGRMIEFPDATAISSMGLKKIKTNGVAYGAYLTLIVWGHCGPQGLLGAPIPNYLNFTW